MSKFNLSYSIYPKNWQFVSKVIINNHIKQRYKKNKWNNSMNNLREIEQYIRKICF